ncbi:MAG: hypothetical protein V1793_16760 [Pseudomonadota bacterium]
MKSLQSHLNHLIWQTQMIAPGDFSQRVDFMAYFSEAFDLLVAKLDQAIQQLRDREQEQPFYTYQVIELPEIKMDVLHFISLQRYFLDLDVNFQSIGRHIILTVRFF